MIVLAVIQINALRVNYGIISIIFLVFWVARKKVTQKAVAIVIF